MANTDTAAEKLLCAMSSGVHSPSFYRSFDLYTAGFDNIMSRYLLAEVAVI